MHSETSLPALILRQDIRNHFSMTELTYDLNSPGTSTTLGTEFTDGELEQT
jgi:hypothetical protein